MLILDGIPKEIRHFTCPGIQEAIDKIMRYGKGTQGDQIRPE